MNQTIAIVTPERQLHTVAGSSRTALTGSIPGMWGSWEEGATDNHSWPTWSPDGSRLAAFRMAREGADSRVFVLSASGEEGQEVASLGSNLPIYLSWSPDGSRLAALTQIRESLILETCNPNQAGDAAPLLQGTPLFFCWTSDHRIAAFVGQTEGPKLMVVDPSKARGPIELPGAPGNFCAPIMLDDDVGYVAHKGGYVAVFRGTPGQFAIELEQVEGLVAIIPSPSGRQIARAIAPDGTGVPYRRIALLHPKTGRKRPIADVPCVAFFWADDEHLVLADLDAETGLVTWSTLDLDGNTTELFVLGPTRDMGFYLRFFEQYYKSHPIIDAEGSTLLLAGHQILPGIDPSGPPKVWEVPLDGSSVRDLGEGLFAVYGPPRSDT